METCRSVVVSKRTAGTKVGSVGRTVFTLRIGRRVVVEKGLRKASVRSHRDAMCLRFRFAAADRGCKITRLSLDDLTLDRILRFLRHLEEDRHNRAHSEPRQPRRISA